MEECIFTEREQVIHQLFLKAYLVKSPGLLYGKMGLGIALFDYGRYTGCSLYSDLGDELTDGILDDVECKTGFDFATGLSGIAWGIEYLVQKGYVECDTNLVCGEIDKRMEKVCVHRLKDLSLETGLEGILHYVLIRLKGSLMQNGNIPFSSDFLDDVQSAVTDVEEDKSSDSLKKMIDVFRGFICSGKRVDYTPDIRSFIIEKPSLENMEKVSLSLRKGLAGWLYAYE